MPDHKIASAHVEVSSRDKLLLEAFERIEAGLGRIERDAKRTNTSISGSNRKTTATFNDMADRVGSVTRQVQKLKAQGKIAPQVAASSLRDLERLNGLIDRADKNDIQVTATLLDKASSELNNLERNVRSIDGNEIHLPVDVDAAPALASLAALKKAASTLDGKTINIDVNVKTERTEKRLGGLVKVTKEVDKALGSTTFIARMLSAALARTVISMPPMIVAMGGLAGLPSKAAEP